MIDKKYKCHLFICTNQKDKGESCGPKNAASLRLNLKKRMDENHPEFKGQFRVNASGCLGQCEKGIAAVYYPQGEWLTEINENDLEKLESKLISHLSR